MPTTTFFNLPEEKRGKLLEASTREFSKRPYNEASINQIVKDAGISRGSFYTYFVDKEELFCYVLRRYLGDLTAVLEDFLHRREGDIFEALLDFSDFVHRQQAGELGLEGDLSAILHRNRGMQRSGVLAMLDPREFLERLAQSVDAEKLDADSETEVREMLGLLLSVTMPILYKTSRPETDTRAYLERILNILKRGMGTKNPAAHCEKEFQ